MAGDRAIRYGRAAGLALLAWSMAMLASGCGETAAAHSRIGDEAKRFWAPQGAATPAPSPNGENSGPAQELFTYQFTVTTTRTVRGAAGKGVGRSIRDPLQVCPVGGPGSFADDFGAPRYAGGFHLHQGNDVFAAMGTPIVAPFDGTAVATQNTLGGLAVTVYGATGYVYNAHLMAYGRFGQVKAGDVIGYMGNTGDAAGGPPHDHFEWHPYGSALLQHVSPYGASVLGSAVDPFPYLQAACVR